MNNNSQNSVMYVHANEVDTCPVCHTTLSLHTNSESLLEGGNDYVGIEPPEPDDFTICWKCESILMYDQNLRLIVASEAEKASSGIDFAELINNMNKQSKL